MAGGTFSNRGAGAMMDFKEQMCRWIEFIEGSLENYIPKQEAFPPVIFEAMRYSLFAGGKRLRPMMVLAACEAVGGDKEEAVPFACAMEMIHTYSLIHDDLPAMDNDDYRRGRLTSHKVFGEDMAILAGDGLLHNAMEVMAEACNLNPCHKTTGAMQAIAQGAGIHGMLVGQVVDVFYEGKPLDRKTLEFIHINKTAAMIRAALKAGAILGGATELVAEKFALAGEKIGVAFQILDDILDVTSTMEELGKPIHSDEKNEKTTYVNLYGIEKSREIAFRLSDEAVSIWDELGDSCNFLKGLTKYLTKRTN
ncbi:farnesyl diphosphate synthase [Anaerotignum neopropionicum]|uniref:Farnesyl diphosphate synthase n=2 Tax=Anaerotignum neopropionicum TaxID=36847 RepID=A0A136WEZ5_9FIRM|nr:farnesyl diphosphate synthase [Anaerotignum neopropionicum]